MIDLLIHIAEQRPRDVRLLGLDVGKKTIGLALSDPAHSIATPLKTIKRTKFMKDMKALEEVVRDYEVGGFIIGLPVSMSGEEGRRAQSVRDFALEMEKYFSTLLLSPRKRGSQVAASKDPRFHGECNNVWIALWDERLSTVSVEGFVDNFVDKKKTRLSAKDSGLIDKLAAQHILQGALGFLGSSGA